MNELTIPPSPNWYLSNVLACSPDGSVVAYGAKHELVIFRITNEPGKPLEVSKQFIPYSHKDRIAAVVFAPSGVPAYKNRLVSSSDDGSVHIWDWETLSLLYSHTGHPDGQKVPCVDWSSADCNLIVSVSDLGSLVCWDLLSNTIRRLYLGTKMLPICLACCPHNKDVIAVGVKAGLVIIFNIKGDGSLIYRIRGHESDVVSLAWCPVPENIFQKEKNENALLLASGAKDRTIYFWRTATDGRFETSLNLPPQPLATNYRNRNGVGGPGNSWICVRWPAPHTILTSSQFGELLSCNLKSLIKILDKNQEGTNKKPKHKILKLVHGNHSKGLFSIAIPSFSDANEEVDPIVWTCALDKHIVATKLVSCKIVIDMTGIGGIVYCLAPSPFDPNRIAVGVGDNKVLIWNMSNGSCDNIATYWQKINNKVMAVAWHPTLESILAFGTGEGRVGILDLAGNRLPIVLRLHHRRSVYSLIWGPPIVESLQSAEDKKLVKWDLALFSVGDGDILQYNINTPEKEPINLGCLISKCDAAAMIGKALGRTDLVWNHDCSLASIGNDNGVIYIVNGKDMSYIHTIYAHMKLVQCLVWHPATVTSETESSPHASWLASAGDCIQVMNVTKEGYSIVATLTSHTEKVVSLAWSPHFNARLISASYDYTCQVWDVISCQALAVFEDHHNAVLCCLSSPLHPNMIISGSADSTIRVWNANNYTASAKPKNKKQRVSGAMKKFAGVQEASDLTAPDGREFKEIEKIDTKKTPEIIGENQMKRKLRSMFPLTGSDLSQGKHLDILWSRINGVERQEDKPLPIATEIGYLDFFGDNKAIRRLLLVEGTHHRDTGNFIYSQHMSLWSGDLAETIKDACVKKHLSEWLVSLAPMVSHKLWVDCCTSYAQQLAESGDALKAASYYLAVHKIEEAVDTLLAGKLVREAVAVAKARLPHTDPTVVKALVAWSNQCNSTGMLSLCAHCLLGAGKVSQAVEILSRSKEASSLALAAEMASKIGATDMAASLVIRSLNKSLSKKDYATAKKTLEPHSLFQDFTLWIDTCKLIEDWNKNGPKNGFKWVCNSIEDSDSIFDAVMALTNDKKPSYDLLVCHLGSKPSRESFDTIWIHIAGQITLAVAAMKSECGEAVVKHLINSLNAAYTCLFQNPPDPSIYMNLSCWLSPKGSLADLDFYMMASNGLVKSLKTFIACGAIYWLHHLYSEPSTADKPSLEDKSDLKAINNVLITTASLILTKDTMAYFKNSVEIKRLENVIAASKLNVPISVKYCTDLEAELCNKIEIQNGIENKSVNGNGSVKGSLKEGNKSNKKEESSEKNKENFSDNERMMLSLTELKYFNKKFDDERVCVPNPIVIYCCIKNIIESLGSLIPSGSGEGMFDELHQMWDLVNEE